MNIHLSTQPPGKIVINVRILKMGKPKHTEVSNLPKGKPLVRLV